MPYCACPTKIMFFFVKYLLYVYVYHLCVSGPIFFLFLNKIPVTETWKTAPAQPKPIKTAQITSYTSLSNVEHATSCSPSVRIVVLWPSESSGRPSILCEPTEDCLLKSLMIVVRCQFWLLALIDWEAMEGMVTWFCKNCSSKLEYCLIWNCLKVF